VKIDKISVKRNWIRHGNTAQDRKIRDLAIKIGKVAVLLSDLLRNLSVLVYDMSVQQPSIIKTKDSNLFLFKKYTNHASPPSEVISLSKSINITLPSS
jgi:hypothetical protein